MWLEWDDGLVALAVIAAPLVPCVIIGGFLYPKQCLAGVAVTAAVILGCTMLFGHSNAELDFRSQ